MSSYRVLLASSAALVFLAMALWVLGNGHPNEDAFIVYTYVENIVHGNGISFYPGGPRSEGTTDFLWLIMLAGLTYVGIDVAISALILNVVGVFVVVYIIAKHALGASPRILGKAVAAALLPALLVSPVASAGLGGYSSFFYAAVAMTAFDCFVDKRPARINLVPIIALMLALIRPDGAVIGMAFTLIGAFRARQLGSLKGYLAGVAFSGLAGALYFIWRYQNFGLLLPLPLYVKGEIAGTLPGLSGNIGWAKVCVVPLSTIVLSLPVLVRPQYRAYLIGLLPFAALLLALLFVDHVTNVALRYQAPATVAVLLVFAVSMRSWLDFEQRRAMLGYAALAVTLLGLTFWPGFAYWLRNMTIDDYMNVLPLEISELVDRDTAIVLTEAGRLGFWTSSPKFDIIGLTTPEFARHAITPADLERLAPGLIMVHTANTLYPVIRRNDIFLKVEWTDLSELIKEEFRDLGSKPSNRKLSALLAIYRFLKMKSEKYAIYIVQSPHNDLHLYAIDKESVPEKKFEEKMHLSLTVLKGKSYLELRMRGVDFSRR